MPSAADRIDFAPARDAGALRSFGLALLIHAALIAALTWGVNWKRDDPSTSFEAELWSAIPQEAAPKPADTPTLPPPPPPPPPEPSPKSQEAPPPALEAPADIALAQQKKRDLLAQQLEEKAQKKAAEQAQAKAEAKAQAKAEAKAEKARKKAA